MATKSSIHIKPCNITSSEAHNRRTPEYMRNIGDSKIYIIPELSADNEQWINPSFGNVGLQTHYDYIKRMVKEKTGRAMQEKERERKGKNGKIIKVAGCSPIREGVLLIKADTTLSDLRRFCNECKQRWGITPIQIFMHKDEGHWLSGEPDTGDKESFKIGGRWFKPNYHAHIVFDWMNHETGKSCKLNDNDMMEMQTLASEILSMERGKSKTVTGKEHLERNDFIIEKQENKKKQLQEEAKKAIAEKEEAEAEIETAKTEVADLWKEHDYLTSANRTKAERSNRLDLDIRTKTNRSQVLDDTIEAKRKEVTKLEAKADKKLQDFYTIKERGDWQDPMFFAMSAYIYRIDEGLQFCIKAIQDFAYSGLGGRGGKHGDIFWDNESYAIKHYLKMFSDLASATLKQVADWFVWLASTLGRFNANELRRADHEVHDIADGRYDGRIQKFQQGLSR